MLRPELVSVPRIQPESFESDAFISVCCDLIVGIEEDSTTCPKNCFPTGRLASSPSKAEPWGQVVPGSLPKSRAPGSKAER